MKSRGLNVNQDCLAAKCDSDGRWVVAVVDGHGDDGHRCSERLCTTLPGLVLDALSSHDGTAATTTALQTAFAEAERDLEATAATLGFDVEQSGGAAVAVGLSPKTGMAYIAACGDSQAAVFSSSGTGFQVNTPHKAHDAEERRRIEAAGGLVKVQRDGQELFSRVYSPHREMGLAMSRSFGDLCVKRHGVTCEPSVSAVPFDRNVCCVLGSDGLFEFLSPAEVVSQLRSRWGAHGASICSEALVAEAQRRWRQEEGDYVDDVTCLLLGLGDVAGVGREKRSASDDVVLLD